MKKFICILLLFFFFFFSCTTTKYIPVETVRTEYKTQYSTDSVYIHDSTTITNQGDTVYIFKYKYKYIAKHDTVGITDSISVPYPVVETKEVNVLYNYQKILMAVGIVAILSIIWLIVKKLYKLWK